MLLYFLSVDLFNVFSTCYSKSFISWDYTYNLIDVNLQVSLFYLPYL